MFDTEKILANANLRELAERAGAEFHHNRAACPLHGGTNPSSFAIFRHEGRDLWKCHTGDCGSGDAIRFVELWQRVDFKGACQFLGADVAADPAALAQKAAERLARAEAEEKAAIEYADARRREMQAARRHLHYHETRAEWARREWEARGLDEGMQEFWTLGSCEAFGIGDGYTTPTLTIPVYSETRDLLNIKHRLMNPAKPKDKYRPETSGLGPFPPFLAVPEMGYDGDTVIVVEGEIKAMVTWTRLDMDRQVIGIPGKSQFMRVAEKIKGRRVVVIPDPGAEREARDLALAVGGRVLTMPGKIDDMMISTAMSADTFGRLLKQARKA